MVSMGPPKASRRKKLRLFSFIYVSNASAFRFLPGVNDVDISASLTAFFVLCTLLLVIFIIKDKEIN